MSKSRKHSQIGNGPIRRIVYTAILVVLAFAATAAYSTSSVALSLRQLFFGNTAEAGQKAVFAERTAEPNLFAPAPLTADLATARSGHSATLLADSRVLVAGGDASGTSEVYDPVADVWASTGNLNAARSGHTATRLADGRVLITGGTVSGSAVSSTETYDPSNGTFSNGPSLTSARSGHTATTLANGSVLITGGGSDTAEVFDGTSFSAVSGAMTSSRTNHSAALMADGRVFIAGGDGSNSAEVFNPADSTFTAAGNVMTLARSHALLRVLPDGKVQIIGGAADGSMEVYDPAIDTIGAYAHVLPDTDPCANLVNYIMQAPTRAALIHNGQTNPVRDRSGYTVTELSGNKAIIVGGTDSNGNPLGTVAVLNSSSATITTNKLDYQPGNIVTFSGTGFQAGETVRVMIHEDPHTPQERGFDAVADGNGTFTGTYLVMDYDLEMKFVVGARGLSSGLTAQTTFTDNKNLVITFAGTGGGSVAIVVASPTPIQNATCTGTPNPCSTAVDNNASGTMTVTPNVGSTFVGWTGSFGGGGTTTCTATTSPCTFSMSNAAQALTATFNANTTPTTPASLAQFKSDGVTSIPTGSATNESAVVLKGSVSDPDAVDTVKLQVEIKPVGVAFTNSFTAESGLLANGSIASVTVPGLVNGTNYHWQARSVDNNGSASAWVSFGGNAESATDFRVDTSAPTVLSINLVGASPTNASQVAWNITFSESVSGLAPADIVFPSTGISSGAVIVLITGSGANYTVSRSTGSGSGTLGLNLNDSDSITDAAGNKLGGTGTGVAGGGGTGNGSFTGQVYTIDRTLTPHITANDKVYDGDTPATLSNCSFTSALTVTEDVNVSCTSPTFDDPNVGTRTVTANVSLTGSAAARYVLSSPTASDSADITQATSSTAIDCSPGSFTYTGSAITPCTATVTRVGDPNTTVAVTYANNTNVGTATANASYAGDANHTGSTATQVTFAITQAASSTSIDCSPGSFTYTGSAITPCTATVTRVGDPNTTATVSYANNTNVGTATANASYPGDANHTGSTATQVTFAITQAGSSTSIDCSPGSFTYTGSAITPCTATVTRVGDPNTTATVSYANNTNAGTATANASYPGDANHTGSTATQVSFTIDKADQLTSVTAAAPLSATYGQTFYVAATGGGSGNPVVIATSGACSGGGNGSAIITMTSGTGTCTVTYDQAGNANYNAAPQVVNNVAAGNADTTTTVNVTGIPSDGSWQTNAASPTARNGSAISTVNGKIYVAGGWNSSHQTDVHEYDPVGNCWTTKANRPTIQSNGTAATINGTMYVAGGTNFAVEINDLWSYDPTTDTWTPKAPLPAVRQAAAGGVMNNLFYVAGGRQGSTYFSSLIVYDPSSNTWATKAAMPTARAHTQGAVVGGKLYVIGGIDAGGNYLTTAEVYDPVADSWATLPSMPTPRGQVSVAAIGTRIYAIGGYTTGNIRVASVDVFDTVSGTWTTAPSLSEARANTTAAAIGQTIYNIGGTTDALTNATSKNESYTAASSSTYGDAVTFTADVSVNSPGAGTATGNVQFFEGVNPIGAPQPLSGGGASVVTSSLDAGVHNITVQYVGDTNVNGSTSGILPHTVEQKTLTVTADDQTITYGDPEPAFTFQYSGGFVSPDTAADIDTPPTCTVSGSHTSVNTYPIVCSGGVDNNYAFTYINGTFTVNQKPASVTPDPASKTYGDSDPVLTGTLTGFLAADSVTATYSRTAGETVAGSPYTISAVLSPAGVLGNYNITYNTADFNITPKAASVTPNASGKTYGDADPVLTGTLSGFLGADGVTATYSRTAGETVAGSPYTISAVLSPAGVLGNYNITYNTADFNITPKAASVTPNASGKTYGDADPVLTGTLSGFLGADGVTATYSRTAGETVAGSPYTISAVLSPAGVLGNYNITYNTADFNITPKAASVTPNASGKTYGDADPVLTGTLSGFLGADGVTATYSRTAGETVAGSPYTISAVLSPAGVLGNYNITYNTADFNITPKAASVTPNASGKTYGDADPVLTGTLSGFLGADGVTATYSRTAGETVAGSPYTISAVLSPAGVLGNYNITYNTANFDITPKAASVTPNASGKTYGDADPVLTGTLSGFLGADGVTATYSRTAGETVAGSPYTISAVLSPAGVLGNYNITYNTANFDITPKAASVTPNASGKTYGDADPVLTGTLSGFLGADGVTATYSRTAGETVAGSPYTISAVLSPAGVLGNYNITYNTANFTINARVATWTTNPNSKSYGDADPSPLTTGSGDFLAADGVTATYSRVAGEAVSPPTYHISATLSPLSVLSNYTITNNGAEFTIVNVAPANVVLSSAVINENDTANLNGTFTDPDPNQPHSVIITWDDGSATTPLTIPAGVHTFSASRQYLDDNPSVTSSDIKSVSVTVSDGASMATGGSTVTVNNVAPVIPTANGPVGPQPLGTLTTVTATFTDVGTQDTHTCDFNWDDTTTTSNVAATEAGGSGTCTASRTFAAPGVYSVIVTVRDDDSGVTTKGIDQLFVVIFDPSGGFVTGGGWIMSPVGACKLAGCNDNTVGKANFGFVSKYKKGSNVPEGQTEFQFQAGNLNFHSSAYDVGSLVISGYKAQYKGLGDINGQTGYKFVLTAYDGKITGGGGVDRFRMKITRISDNVVVYDNRMGDTDDIDNVPMALSGGSINIQKAGK